MPAERKPTERPAVERRQTGVRLERRLIKALKAVAQYHNLSVGHLLEAICLHAFEGKSPFDRKELATIRDLKRIYSLDLDAHNHRLVKKDP